MDSRSTQLAHALESRGWDRETESSPLHARLTAGALAALDSVPARWKLGVVLPLGAAAAAGVAYVTSKNPSAAPANVAVVFRILLIASLIATGLYTLTTNIQKRLGCLLLAAGFFCSLWLLNGSRDALPFTIGVVLSGVGPTLFAYLMLAHPTGHVRSGERRFLLLAGGVLATLWVLAIAMTRQPPLKAPLLQCAPHCPTNVISFGSADQCGHGCEGGDRARLAGAGVRHIAAAHQATPARVGPDVPFADPGLVGSRSQVRRYSWHIFSRSGPDSERRRRSGRPTSSSTW